MGQKVGKIEKRNRFNLFSYQYRWLFSMGFVFFIFVAFMLKGMKDYTFVEEANAELRQLFSERQAHLRDFLEDNEVSLQVLLEAPEFKQNIEKLKTSDPLEKEKALEALRRSFRYHQKEVHYGNTFILSAEGQLLFELKKKNSASFQFLNEDVGAEHEQEEGGKQRTLKSVFERVRMTLAPAYSEFIYDQKEKKPFLYLVVPVLYEDEKPFFVVIEVDYGEIYKITNDFEGLGETGEIVLGKHVGNSVVLVAPTRKNKQIAFKSLISLKSKNAIPIIRASKGIEGSGQFLDYLENPIYAVWGFIPQLNLGMVVKKDVSELVQQTFLFSFFTYLSITLALVSFFFFIYGFLHVKGKAITAKGADVLKVRKRFLQTLFWLSLFILSLTFFYQQFVYYQAVNLVEKQEKQYLAIAEQQIDHSLKNVEGIAYSFAKDYQTERIDAYQIAPRLDRDLREHPEILGISVAYRPYKYAGNQKLYATFYYRSGQKTVQSSLESYTDYTRPFNEETSWYMPTLRENRHWTQPFYEKLSQQLVVSFAVPFYAPKDKGKKDPLGIVTVYYPLSTIKKLVNYYDIGFSGYYFLLSEKGQYIYHPFDGYAENKIKLYDIARTLESKHLISLEKMIESDKKGHIDFRDPRTGGTTLIHFETLPQSKWVIAKHSSKEELLSGQFDAETEKLILFIEIIVSFTFLALMLGKFYLFTTPCIRTSLGMVTLVLGIGNMTLWGFIYENSTKQEDTDLKITDPLTLNVFIDEQLEKAYTLDEPLPAQLPTGFYIKVLDIDKEKQLVSLNANLWQSLEGDFRDRDDFFGFTLPQAASLELKKAQEKEFKDKKTKLWDLKAKLFQNFSYKYYPFDTHQLKIHIEPHSSQENLVFVPDLEAYRFITPSAKPGLSKDIQVSGFTIIESYFSYQPLVTNTNFGFDDQSMSNAQTIINFVISLKRNILDSAIVYFCPLLLILFFLFVTLLALEKWASSSFGAVSALLFTLILLQRALRLSLGSNEIVYIEYLFFATYIMLLLAVIYIILSFLYPKLAKRNSLFNTFVILTYWPVLFSMWLFSTIYVFYLT
ncbi:MAG TPA: hypothetical protein DD412_06925 [Holosporales bacterium]|nr:hypothetical protein [Holosporales bacterium]